MIGFILSWSGHFLNCSFRWWVFHIQKSYWVTYSRVHLSPKFLYCWILGWTWTNILSNICEKHAVNASFSLYNIFWTVRKCWLNHIMARSRCDCWLFCYWSLNRSSRGDCLCLTHRIRFWNQFSMGSSNSCWQIWIT